MWVLEGQDAAEREREVVDSFDAEAAGADRPGEAVVAVVVGAGCEAAEAQTKGASQTWKSVDPCVNCICYPQLEMGWVEELEQPCRHEGDRYGTAVACSSGSREAVASSLSEADACCFGKEA